MAHSYANNLMHVIFSTKERRKSIPKSTLPDLWSYFGGIARNKGIPLIIAGGAAEHAHLLLACNDTAFQGHPNLQSQFVAVDRAWV